MKTKKRTSFRSIAWLLSISMLLVWLMSMSFITYTQAEKYHQQMLDAGTDYAGQFVDYPILPHYPDYQLRPDAYEGIEHLLMDAIGNFSGGHVPTGIPAARAEGACGYCCHRI